MEVHLVSATLPPQLDGIGDYTAAMATALSARASVKIWTGTSAAPLPVRGARVEAGCDLWSERGLVSLARRVTAERPEWVLLQYNPFSYGRWGWNPALVGFAQRLRASGTRVALMVHEPFVPADTWKFAVMTVWQRWQLWALGRASAAIFFSIDPWVSRFRGWFASLPVVHLPVGSNVPRVTAGRSEVRRGLEVDDETLVLGVFGTLHPSRQLASVRAVAEALGEAGRRVCFLYIGPHGEAFRAAAGSVPVIAGGPLAPEEVSRRFAAIDLYLAPFTDGVSTRRTSFMTALQHGIPCVGTRGFLTDRVLQEASGTAFLLADASDAPAFRDCATTLAADPERRRRIGAAGEQLYRGAFAHEVTAERLLLTLQAATV